MKNQKLEPANIMPDKVLPLISYKVVPLSEAYPLDIPEGIRHFDFISHVRLPGAQTPDYDFEFDRNIHSIVNKLERMNYSSKNATIFCNDVYPKIETVD